MLRAVLNKSCRQHPTNSSCTTTYHPSRKLSKLEEPDMRDTAGEVRANSQVMYSCGLLHMDEQRQNDQQEPMYHSSVSIQEVAWRTCREQWMGGEKGSEKSVQAAWHEDDCVLFHDYLFYESKENWYYSLQTLLFCRELHNWTWIIFLFNMCYFIITYDINVLKMAIILFQALLFCLGYM